MIFFMNVWACWTEILFIEPIYWCSWEWSSELLGRVMEVWEAASSFPQLTSLWSSLCCCLLPLHVCTWYSFLSSNSACLWNCTWQGVVTNSPSLLFFHVCCGSAGSVDWWKWKIVTTALTCGSWTQDVVFCCLRDDFWRVFCTPQWMT